MPSEACWGPITARHDLTDVVCWWSRPLTVWLVGHATEMSYGFSSMDPWPRLTMELELLRGIDRRIASNCVDAFNVAKGMTLYDYGLWAHLRRRDRQ